MTRKKNDVEEVLSTLLHIADENAKQPRAVRPRGLTPADIERVEWESFQAKMQRRARLLGDDLLAEDDDDGEALVLVVTVLAGSKTPLTAFEVMRALQKHRHLSHSFPAAARAQTLSLLGKLRVANRVWQDPFGRWALL